MEFNQWSEILSAINADNSLNESNVIEKIKEKLKEEDKDEYEKWEKADFDVSHQFKDGSTLLYWATKMGNKEVAELLIKKGANPNLQNNNTPLHCAVERNDKGLVEVLLKAEGFDLNAQSRDGSPLLHWACAIEQSNKDLVEVLLKAKGINVNEQSENGDTPLHCAVGGDHEDVLEVLLTAGANVNAKNKDGKTPLYYACSAIYYNEDIVKVLLQSSAKVDATIPLHMAAKHGDIEIVNALIKAGANVNAENKDKWTPLHFAAAWGHKDVLEVLLTAGGNVNAENKNKWTPLYLAAVRGHKDVLEVLLTAGANVNAQDENGKTPLYYACSTGYYNKDIVKVLLQNGAKVDATIPLHMAAEHGDIEIVNALIGKNANVNEVDENGRTPLHLATELSRKYVVEVLLTAGADINAQDKNGKTPLHCATNRSWLCSLVGGIAELLIEKGANLDLQDNDGKTPLRFAIEKQDKNVAEALIRGTLIQNSSIQKPDYLTDEFSTYWDKHKKVVTGQLADRERSTASSSANQSISNSNHTSVQSNIMPILKKGNTKNNNVPPSDLSKNVNTPHSTQESKLPIITASIGLLLGLSIAYLTGAAALTPAIAAVAVFIAAAVAGALLGYGIGKVSGQFSDASISEHDSKQAAAGLI